MPTTRQDTARRALGEALGGFFVGSAFGGSTTTITTPIAAFDSSELPDDALAYGWVYLPNGTTPKLRRVKQTGLNGTTYTITVDAAFGSAVGNGTVFEYSARLPSSRDYGGDVAHGEVPMIGLNEALNLTARVMSVTDGETVTLALVDGQQDYDLSSWWWLDRPERLIEIRQPNVDGSTYKPTKKAWSFRESASGPSIHFEQPFRFSTGAYTIKLVVKRPADTLLYRGGVWTDTSAAPGATADTDAYPLDVNELVQGALAYCYRELRNISVGSARARYTDRCAEQWAILKGLPHYDTTLEGRAPAGPTAPPVAERAA